MCQCILVSCGLRMYSHQFSLISSLLDLGRFVTVFFIPKSREVGVELLLGKCVLTFSVLCSC